MGIRLVREAILFACPQLPGTHPGLSARLCLVTMASLAHDNHDPPWYGQGWQPLAAAIGAEGSTNAKKIAVSRATTQLVDTKLISRSYLNHDGTTRRSQMPARWILHPHLWITNL